MIIGNNVKILMMVFLACILLVGTAPVAMSQEETAGTTEQNQRGVSEEKASAPEMRTIQIIRNSLSPETIEINQYDTVVWRNLNRPKGTFVLESKDKLWEDYSLGYGKSFSYTFNETGTFNFSVKDGEVIEGTVVVKERTEVISEPVAMSQDETAGTTEQNQRGVSEENASAPEMRTIQIIRYSLSPETIEINQSDIVVWRNLNRPKGTFVLESKDKLWEDYSLGYGKSFSYTFNETGTFTFSVKDGKVMEGTVVVKERTEVTSEEVQLTQEEQESQIQKERAEEQNISESVEGTSNLTEEAQTSENFVMIRDAAFYPEAIDLSKGKSLTIRNLSKPKRSFVLVSEENLFEDTLLGYGKSFAYIFDKSGTYTFRLDNVSETQLVVTVQ